MPVSKISQYVGNDEKGVYKGNLLSAVVDLIIHCKYRLIDLFPGYVDNLYKPDHRVILLHVMENLINVKDMSKSPFVTDQ